MKRALAIYSRPAGAKTSLLHCCFADNASGRAAIRSRVFALQSNSMHFEVYHPKVHPFWRSAFIGSVPQKQDATISFNLADIGEGITEVEVLQWFVKEGDSIKAFDRICEVQSDKATVEISSPYDGLIVKIHHAIGDMAFVGKPLVDIQTSAAIQKGSTPAAGTPSPSSPKSAAKDNTVDPPSNTSTSLKDEGSKSPKHATGKESRSESSSGGKPLAVPAVRAIVKQYGLDLSMIKGSGRDGRVSKSDVIEYVKEHKFDDHHVPVESPLAAATAPPTQPTRAPTPHTPPARAANSANAAAADKTEAVRGYMRTMIKTMQAQALVPHMGLSDEYDVDEAVKLRDKLKATADARGVRMTLLPIIIKAVSAALNEYPQINARLSDDLQNIEYRSSHNIGIAIETSNGLVVPNVKNVQSMSLIEIAAEVARLVDLAKAQKLSSEDISGGTITISNIGAIGGTYAAPILMPKESAIVALGSIQRLPRYRGESDVVHQCKVMTVSWSADHRLLQGSVLARFSNRVKELLKDPSLMMIDMR